MIMHSLLVLEQFWTLVLCERTLEVIVVGSDLEPTLQPEDMHIGKYVPIPNVLLTVANVPEGSCRITNRPDYSCSIGKLIYISLRPSIARKCSVTKDYNCRIGQRQSMANLLGNLLMIAQSPL